MIRIVSENGRTTFLDVDSGEDISHLLPCRAAEVSITPDAATARLDLTLLNLDLRVAADCLAPHPILKSFEPVASITFRDGWQIEFPEGGAPRVRQIPTGEQ